jgi:hypothetical protein
MDLHLFVVDARNSLESKCLKCSLQCGMKMQEEKEEVGKRQKPRSPRLTRARKKQ